MARPLNVEGPVSPDEVDAAYKVSVERHDRERLLAIRMAQKGYLSLDQIGDLLLRGRATIARWIKNFRDGGLDKLLERRHEGGKPARLHDEDVQGLARGLKNGQWKTAREVQEWLAGERGIKLKLSGVYYWLRKLKGRGRLALNRDINSDH